MTAKKNYISPIRSFDFYLENYHKLLKKLKVEHDVEQLQSVIDLPLPSEIKQTLETTDYDALVVTNLKKEILWANNGFKEMTGYSKSFAIGKKPTFLQGVNTAKTALEAIRELVKKQKRFSYTLTNYRKNGEEYQCQIEVLPLHDRTKKVTHFLAMEREKEVA